MEFKDSKKNEKLKKSRLKQILNLFSNQENISNIHTFRCHFFSFKKKDTRHTANDIYQK